jgi:hypothetical protein
MRKETRSSLRNALINSLFLPRVFLGSTRGYTLETDFITPQAFGETMYSDRLVGLMERIATLNRPNDDIDIFEWLRLQEFDPGYRTSSSVAAASNWPVTERHAAASTDGQAVRSDGYRPMGITLAYMWRRHHAGTNSIGICSSPSAFRLKAICDSRPSRRRRSQKNAV